MPDPVPLAGDTLSHGAPSETLQSSVPPPAFAMVNDCALGSAAPAVLLNDRLVGLTDSSGGVGASFLKTTAAMSHGVLAPVETRGAGVSPRPATASSTANSMSDVGDTFTRWVKAGSATSVRPKPES